MYKKKCLKKGTKLIDKKKVKKKKKSLIKKKILNDTYVNIYFNQNSTALLSVSLKACLDGMILSA